jgi:hypothetical protein
MIFALFLIAAQTELTQMDREDLIWSFSQCAAFHAIEADMAQNGAGSADAQRAVSRDFLEAAHNLAGAAGIAAVDSQAQQIEKDHRTELAKGDARAMAEGWTALESACKEQYPALAALRREPQAKDADAR